MIIESREAIAEAVNESAFASVASAFMERTKRAAVFASTEVKMRRGQRPPPLPATAKSWFEGLPRLPAEIAWPRAHGQPMELLCQIDLGSVPDLDDWPNQPNGGALLLFQAQEFYEHEDASGAAMYIEPTDAPLRAYPEDYAGDAGQPNVFGYPMRAGRPMEFAAVGWSPPQPDREGIPGMQYQIDGRDFFNSGIPALAMLTNPVVQLLGEPDLVQFHPERVAPGHRLLAQVDDGVFLHHFMISEADLEARRFDRSTHSAQCD